MSFVWWNLPLWILNFLAVYFLSVRTAVLVMVGFGAMNVLGYIEATWRHR